MPEEPLFDSSVFRGLCSELGNEDAVEVLLAFLGDAPDKMAVMSGTIDRPSIKLAAHSIKSSAATFGFANLAALARGDGGHAIFFGVEAARRAAVGEFFDAGGFDDAAFGGEVAVEDVWAAGFLEGFGDGDDDVLIRSQGDVFEILLERLAGNGDAVAVKQACIEEDF